MRSLRCSLRRFGLGLGLASALVAGAAFAQQPGVPTAHQPPGGQPQLGQPPSFPQPPPRSNGIPPGRLPGAGGRPLSPGHGGLPVPGGRPGGRFNAAAENESASHGAEEHCPGHGPTDPPPHVNWWHGLIGVNNERAGRGGLDSLLWRYENPTDPCDSKNEPPPFLASLLNFALLAFVIVRFGKKPVAEALQKRKQTITHEIDTATQLKADAEARLEEYEEKLERIEETRADLKSDYASQAEIEKAHILAEAEQRRTRMRRDAEFRIEQELKEARSLLLQEAVQNAATAAEALIRQRIGAEDLDRLAEDYLRAVPKALAGGNTGAPQNPGAAS